MRGVGAEDGGGPETANREARKVRGVPYNRPSRLLAGNTCTESVYSCRVRAGSATSTSGKGVLVVSEESMIKIAESDHNTEQYFAIRSPRYCGTRKCRSRGLDNEAYEMQFVA
ncbi:unnamed protein product [Protopolystoma xenopodis]|uniref:Uncharacterized protein n=1 Tax=Protopolystoma xenopodis TaxID=117903 RepID=A0A3S5B649_9PLAT|nr:unnamed protein product [Protopolystoma xenopodis]